MATGHLLVPLCSFFAYITKYYSSINHIKKNLSEMSHGG